MKSTSDLADADLKSCCRNAPDVRRWIQRVFTVKELYCEPVTGDVSDSVQAPR